MARVLRQIIPKAPTEYDQNYIQALADAINRYIVQREAQAETIAARFVMTDVPADVARPGPPAIAADDVSTLATGTMILRQVPGTSGEAGLFLTVVTPQDRYVPPPSGPVAPHRSVK